MHQMANGGQGSKQEKIGELVSFLILPPVAKPFELSANADLGHAMDSVVDVKWHVCAERENTRRPERFRLAPGSRQAPGGASHRAASVPWGPPRHRWPPSGSAPAAPPPAPPPSPGPRRACRHEPRALNMLQLAIGLRVQSPVNVSSAHVQNEQGKADHCLSTHQSAQL